MHSNNNFKCSKVTGFISGGYEYDIENSWARPEETEPQDF